MSKLPEGWKYKKLGEVCDIKGGKRLPKGIALTKENTGFPYITVSDMNNDGILLNDIQFVPIQVAPKIKNYRVASGDLYVVVVGSTIGKVGQIPPQLHNANLTENADKLTNFKADPNYILHILRSDIFQGGIEKLKTHNAQPKLALERLRDLFIPLPALPEQRAIAAILSTWDEVITLTSRLVDALKRRKQALMQLLLTGEVRFAEFDGKWEYTSLENSFQRVVSPVEDSHENILSITATVGFVDQASKFGRVIAGKNLDRYIRLLRGEFAYNKGNSNFYPQGCIYRLDEFDEGAVPNVYYCFRINSDNLNSDFYKHYFENGALNEQLRPLINAGVRNDGLLNISAESFFSVEVLVPPFEEQEHIANFFNDVNQEIKAREAELTYLATQKRGLMQQLLTGAIRVQVDEG